MPLDWMDVTQVPFNALLLLERVQLSWLPGWGLPQPAFRQALCANPAVAWFMTRKCPPIAGWVGEQLAQAAVEPPPGSPEAVRQAEVTVLAALVDLLVYALDPSIYDALPFVAWDDRELTGLVDFGGRTVIDVGAGPGRLALVAAPLAEVVYAVEPVGNLRVYLREKARRLGFHNLYVVDGLITEIPFPDNFAHVTLSGHVFGDFPAEEYAELMRVTCPGGMVVLCPGSSASEERAHAYLVEQGFQWRAFLEPPDSWVRKYWKVKE